MKNKQTPVQWLHLEFQKRFPKQTSEMYENNQLDYEDMIIKAKQMEKEQSRKDYYGGVRDEMQNLGSDFEDYYNKTYANDTTKGLPEENSKRRGWHY